MKKTLMILNVCIALFLLPACEPVPEDAFVRHFVIRKGNHYSTPKFAQTLQADRLVFDAKFDESAVYDFGDRYLQTNKNKLFGFSDCNSLHHENSARFAWQWFNDRLEIYAYCYVDGERVEEFVDVVDINEFNRYEIGLTEEHYLFRLNDKIVSIARSNDVCNTGGYYLLAPYFGGSVAAPHDVRIDLRMVFDH